MKYRNICDHFRSKTIIFFQIYNDILTPNFPLDVNEDTKSTIQTAMRYVEESSCISFTDVTGKEYEISHYVRFTNKSAQCYSSIGLVHPHKLYQSAYVDCEDVSVLLSRYYKLDLLIACSATCLTLGCNFKNLQWSEDGVEIGISAMGHLGHWFIPFHLSCIIIWVSNRIVVDELQLD